MGNKNGGFEHNANRGGSNNNKPQYQQAQSTTTCPNGHRLKSFKPGNGGFQCDGCYGTAKSWDTLYGCRACNYDLCENCQSKPPSANRGDPNFLKLKELGIGEDDAERREACRRNPGNLVGAMEFLLKLKREKEQRVNFIKSKYPNLSEDRVKDLLEKHDYDLEETMKYIEKQKNDDEKDEVTNEQVAELFMGLLALSVMNNANENSLEAKIKRIQNKYPELDEDTIKDLLGRHDGDVDDTMKFIEIKKRQHEERQRQLVLARQREEEQKEEVTEDQLANLMMGLISLAIVEEAGFCTASYRNCIEIIKRLSRVEPKGSTAFRDAVINGIIRMLKVKGILMKLGSLKHKFIHIVLTDGEDTASEHSKEDLMGFMLRIGLELGDLCKTYFIGVGLDGDAAKDLAGISILGGESCELFNCDDVEISDVFNRISLSLGIRHQIIAMEHQGMVFAAENKQLAVQLQENKFLVLFTLDMSGSMEGQRWKKVVSAVAAFLTGLKEHDIVGCILFNDKHVCITD